MPWGKNVKSLDFKLKKIKSVLQKEQTFARKKIGKLNFSFEPEFL
jgi:hypothetical protein